MIINTEFTRKTYSPLPLNYTDYMKNFNTTAKINEDCAKDEYSFVDSPKNVHQRENDLVIGSNIAETIHQENEYIFRRGKSSSRRGSIRYEEILEKRSASCSLQKVKSTKLRLDLYLMRKFKLNLKNLLPILQVLGKGSSIVEQILKFFLLNNLHLEFSDCFPLKLTVPVGYSFKAKVEFSEFKFYEGENKEMKDSFFFLPT